MSTLQVSNIHFESTGNNRLQFTGSNSYNLVGGGVTVATINSTAVGFPVSFAVNNVVANDSISVGAVLVANSTVVNATHLGGVISSSYQLNSTLSANVAQLTSNSTSFVGSVSAANVVSNTQLSSNLANYQTTAGLAANVAKLASNSALYANASITNAFTVGTSAYFVSNGNFGIANNVPTSKLSVEGTSYLGGDITLLGAVVERVYNFTGTALDPSNGTIQQKTLSAGVTLTDSINSGESITLMIAANGFTVTWPTITWKSGIAPTLGSGYTVIQLWKAGAVLYGVLVGTF